MLTLLALLACHAPEGKTPGDCTNGADDDVDGLFDCSDDGCSGSPDCATEGDTDTDTVDTDSDSDTDGGDSGADTDTGGDTDTGTASGPLDRWSGDQDLVDLGGIALTGERAGDNAGWRDVIGDVDGDGVLDLVVAAPVADDNGADSGGVYVVKGPVTSGGSLGTVASATLLPEGANDWAGYGLALADLDGDGDHEIVVGAQDYDRDGAGAVYVLSAPLSGDVAMAGGTRWVGEAKGDFLGYAVAGLGDTNGDGKEDAIVGAPGNGTSAATAGAAYLITGPGPKSGPITAASAAIYGSKGGYNVGMSVGSAGDLDGDGLADVAVGLPGYVNPTLNARTGAVAVFYGPVSGTKFESSADLLAEGHTTYDEIGDDPETLDAADTNGDGYDDLLIGHPYDTGGGTQHRMGAVYVVAGGASRSGTLDLFLADGKLVGPDVDARNVGTGVRGAGDADGDGYEDVLVGDSGVDKYGSESGAVYVVYGPISGTQVLDDVAPARFLADGAGWVVGWGAIAAGGDVTGDGVPDWIIGAPGGDDTHHGVAYVVPAGF